MFLARRRCVKIIGLLFMVCLVSQAHAQDVYPFENEQQSVRFQQLNNALRCVECQGQSVAESFTRLANDVKRFNHKAILQGKSDEEIIQFLTQRYGNEIYAKPPRSGAVLFLWFAPALFLLSVFVLVWRKYIRVRNA